MGADFDRDSLRESGVREGDVLAGRYRVERVLAMGGMGIVVAARHVQLNQRVAVKVLTVSNADSSQANARFLTEAKASALLAQRSRRARVGRRHARQRQAVHGDGAARRRGPLASARAAKGQLPIEVAVDYVLQACEGIAEAHAARIVHRDLKPANLFRVRNEPDGSELIKVLDFGVSKALSKTFARKEP